jgi:hypothetical protein
MLHVVPLLYKSLRPVTLTLSTYDPFGTMGLA